MVTTSSRDAVIACIGGSSIIAARRNSLFLASAGPHQRQKARASLFCSGDDFHRQSGMVVTDSGIASAGGRHVPDRLEIFDGPHDREHGCLTRHVIYGRCPRVSMTLTRRWYSCRDRRAPSGLRKRDETRPWGRRGRGLPAGGVPFGTGPVTARAAPADMETRVESPGHRRDRLRGAPAAPRTPRPASRFRSLPAVRPAH